MKERVSHQGNSNITSAERIAMLVIWQEICEREKQKRACGRAFLCDSSVLFFRGFVRFGVAFARGVLCDLVLPPLIAAWCGFAPRRERWFSGF